MIGDGPDAPVEVDIRRLDSMRVVHQLGRVRPQLSCEHGVLYRPGVELLIVAVAVVPMATEVVRDVREECVLIWPISAQGQSRGGSVGI